MALRDQPYLPLYVQDFLTDEKLIECSAETTGVYIRLMCIMHKSEDYGTVLLKQKDKQTHEQIKNFALKLAKQMPYPADVIQRSLTELIQESVLVVDGDLLLQKRMIKDNLISLKRATAGSKGGKFAQAKLQAKDKANTENEIEYEYGINTIVDSTTIVDAENEIHFGKVNGHKVMIQKVYVTDKVKVIHDLRDYFSYTNQLADIERAGLTKFDEFMEANPANIFKDDSHLYNSFRKFCQDGGSVKKKVNKGKIQ